MTSSSQCHNNPVLVPPCKPPDTVKGLYHSQTYYLKTRVCIWARMDVVPVQYVTFTQKFYLTMWLFQFITVITFNWYHVICRSIYLLLCIDLWTKFRIYRIPPDPVRWSCRGFGFLWQSFMLNQMLQTKNDFKVSHRKQVNAPSNMKLVTSLINFECHPCGIFEGFPYHQEDEVIDPIIFAATAGLEDRTKNLFSSNFMSMASSVSVIFDTGATYSCSSNKGDFMKLEKYIINKSQRHIKRSWDFWIED